MTNSLSALIKDINAAHEACIASVRGALNHAYRAGAALLEAKAQVEHGKWLDWVARHCTFSERTAQRYIQVAQRMSNPNTTRASFSSIREALARPEESDPHHELARLNNRMSHQSRLCDRNMARWESQVEQSTDVGDLTLLDRRLWALQNEMAEARILAGHACGRALSALAERLGITQRKLWEYVSNRIRQQDAAFVAIAKGM